MKIISAILLLTLSSALLSACDSEKVEVLKSPCAGIDGSPCGPKRAPAGNPQGSTMNGLVLVG